jgi:tetratricopeptide (TPR) repeat protein
MVKLGTSLALFLISTIASLLFGQNAATKKITISGNVGSEQILLPVIIAHAQTGEAMFKKAENFRNNAKTDSALVFYAKAAEAFKKESKTEDFINAYNQIGILLTRRDEYEKARPFLETALSTGQSSLDSNNLMVANTYISLGVLEAAEDHFEKALIFHNKALEIRQARLGQDHTDVATSYGNIGNVYFRSKDFDKAVENHLHALAIREYLFGETSAEVIQSLVNLGNAYREKQDYATSLYYFDRALETKSLQLDEKKDLSKFYKNISDVYYLMNNKTQGDAFKAKAQ